jgi:hypothetical protein
MQLCSVASVRGVGELQWLQLCYMQHVNVPVDADAAAAANASCHEQEPAAVTPRILAVAHLVLPLFWSVLWPTCN